MYTFPLRTYPELPWWPEDWPERPGVSLHWVHWLPPPPPPPPPVAPVWGRLRSPWFPVLFSLPPCPDDVWPWGRRFRSPKITILKCVKIKLLILKIKLTLKVIIPIYHTSHLCNIKPLTFCINYCYFSNFIFFNIERGFATESKWRISNIQSQQQQQVERQDE